MNKIEGSFDLKHLTTTTTGKPKSLDYRVQFHYNVKGQLKQISPWHAAQFWRAILRNSAQLF